MGLSLNEKSKLFQALAEILRVGAAILAGWFGGGGSM